MKNLFCEPLWTQKAGAGSARAIHRGCLACSTVRPPPLTVTRPPRPRAAWRSRRSQSRWSVPSQPALAAQRPPSTRCSMQPCCVKATSSPRVHWWSRRRCPPFAPPQRRWRRVCSVPSASVRRTSACLEVQRARRRHRLGGRSASARIFRQRRRCTRCAGTATPSSWSLSPRSRRSSRADSARRRAPLSRLESKRRRRRRAAARRPVRPRAWARLERSRQAAVAVEDRAAFHSVHCCRSHLGETVRARRSQWRQCPSWTRRLGSSCAR